MVNNRWHSAKPLVLSNEGPDKVPVGNHFSRLPPTNDEKGSKIESSAIR